MKKYLFVFSAALLLSASISAQAVKVKPVKAPAVPKATPQATILKTSLDSFYYSLGVNIAFNLKDQGVETVNNALLKKGMEDVFKNQPIAVTEQQANMSIQKKLQEFMAKRLNAEKEKGKAFLAENAKRKGVVVLPNGLQYEVIKKGDSTSARPGIEDTVIANYAGTLIDGKEFDNSYKRGQPLTIAVNGVIKGWTEALMLMHIGDKWKVYIPSDLGYQDRGAGAIPGGATLVFEMELLGIKSKATPPPAVEQKVPDAVPPVIEAPGATNKAEPAKATN